MPELSTDDGPRKLRAVWLGPKGATLPFEWTYVQWAVTLAMIPVGVLIVAGLIALAGVATIGHPPWFTLAFGLIYGGPAGIYGAMRIMRGVTFDEPLRYKIDTARQEVAGQDRIATQKPVSWRMPWPNIRPLEQTGLSRIDQDIIDNAAAEAAQDQTTAPGPSR